MRKNFMHKWRRYSENVQTTKGKDQTCKKLLKNAFQTHGQSQGVTTNEASPN